jgi:hypothetical protein
MIFFFETCHPRDVSYKGIQTKTLGDTSVRDTLTFGIHINFGSSCNLCNVSREQIRYSTMSTVGNYQNLLLLASLFIDHSGLGKEAMYLQNKR